MKNRRPAIYRTILMAGFLAMFSAEFRLVMGQCPLERSLLEMGLKDIQREIPGVLVDLRYSSTNNFLGSDIYGCLARAFARPIMIGKLKKAAQLLEKEHPGFHLLIFDAARPLSCQYALWNALDFPESKKHIYVADPRKGSIHNYGCAVDLSIADVTGKEIDMGTAFDFFGELAQPRCEKRLLKSEKLTRKQFQNRQILRSCMTRAGFSITSSEWWHFNACSRKAAASRWKMIP